MSESIAVRTLLVFLLALFVGCGGGSGDSSAAQEQEDTGTGTGNDDVALTVQELLESCVTTDVPDLAALLDVLQNLLDEDAMLPQPQLDLLRLLVDGKVGFALDLDEDGTNDLTGAFGFLDAQGDPTVPLDAQTIQEIASGGDVDLQAIVAELPPGTTFLLDFELPNLPGPALTGDAPPSGTVEFTLGDDGVTEVSGGGSFRSGDCSFDFSFDDVGDLDTGIDGFPVASVGFDLAVGEESLGGSIELDGTSTAVVRAARGGGDPEIFELDLETGALVPGR